MRKFIKAFEAGAAFDPDTVHILIGAFDDAWASLLNSGAPFAAENHSETARDILAKHIVKFAFIEGPSAFERSDRGLTLSAAHRRRCHMRGNFYCKINV
jgi:hypothetical protein